AGGASPFFRRKKTMTRTHVIALHCSGSSAKQWRSLSQRLAGRHPTWCPDLVGSGGNGHWHGERPFGLADEAAAIVSVIDTLPGAVHHRPFLWRRGGAAGGARA